MDDNEGGLRQLLQSATGLGGAGTASGGSRLLQQPAPLNLGPLGRHSNERSPSTSPLSNSLLATLLPSGGNVSSSSTNLKHSSSSGSGLSGKNPLAMQLKSGINESLMQMPEPQSLSNINQTIQELHLDAIKCETTSISQVKNSSQMPPRGTLIAVTRHAIAYVLNDRKIRMIAQDNAAIGLMELHDPSRLPIVDLAWSTQDKIADECQGLNMHPSQQMLASLSKGGELCIGAVYAESSTSLVWDPINIMTFPELEAARGVTWSTQGSSSLLLAVYGTGPEVFIVSLKPTARTAALTTDVESIEALSFSEDGSYLYVAGLDRVVTCTVRSVDETIAAESIALPPGVQRVWLFNHERGTFVLAAIDDGQLIILPLFGHNPSEVIIAVTLPGNADDLFAVYDAFTSTVCVGSHSSSRLVCLKVSEITCPIVAAGSWPNQMGLVSAFATSQLHSVLGSGHSNPANSGTDMYIYAYHTDSVKMHRLAINWETTKSADEPKFLPSPSHEILRPLRSSSTPAVPKDVGHLGGGIPANQREFKEPRELRESRELKEPKESREPKESKELRDVRGFSSGSGLCSSQPQQQGIKLRSSASNAGSDSQGLFLGIEGRDAALIKEISSVVTKQIQEQNKQIRRERHEIETADRRRQQDLMNATIQGFQQVVTSHFSSIIHQHVAQSLEAKMDETTQAIIGRVDQQITKQLDMSLNRSIGNGEKLGSIIASQINKSLIPTINGSIKEVVENSLVPGLQSMMTDLIGQLSANISQAIVDSTVEQYKLLMKGMAELRQTVVELQHLTYKMPSAQDLARTLTDEIKQSLSPVIESVGMMSNASKDTSPHSSSQPSLTRELENLLKQGRQYEALVKVLETGNITLLDWIIGKVEVTDVLDEIPTRVMLSLAQQLGFELTSMTGEKLTWLAELFTVFNPKAAINGDSEIATMISPVLDELFANLRVLFTQHPSSSPLHKQVKTVMRLVRFAMDSD